MKLKIENEQQIKKKKIKEKKKRINKLKKRLCNLKKKLFSYFFKY